MSLIRTVRRGGLATRRWCVPLFVTTLVLGAAVVVQPGAQAAGRADLTLTHLAPAVRSVPAGGSLVVKDRGANIGTARAGASRTRFWLSIDRRPGRGDVVLGTNAVPALRPGTTDRSRTSLRVPAGTAARAFHLIACADATRKVRELKEGNNCRVAASRVWVTRPGGDPPPGPGTFPQEPNPLDVSYTVDAERSVTEQVVPDAGASITTTAADGTSFVLDVPAGALLGPVEITLTPVVSVTGSPLGGVDAVEILPHGLVLQEPATLTITSADPAPVDQQTPFLFHEDGEDLHLHPALLPTPAEIADGTGAVVRLPLTHFSTAGVGAGTDADRAAVGSRTPARTAAQYEQAAAELANAERESQLAGNPPSADRAEALVALGEAYFEDIVAPLLEAAKTDASLAADAIGAGLGWYRQLQLLGGEDEARWQRILSAIYAIIRNAIDDSYRSCVQDHRLDQIVVLIGIERSVQLLGLEERFPDALVKAEACAHFEVTFDARLTSTYHDSDGERSYALDGVWDMAAEGIKIDLSSSGEGDLAWQEFSYEEVWTSSCGEDGVLIERLSGIGSSPGTISAHLGLDPNAYALQPGDPPPTVDGRLRLVPGGAVTTWGRSPTETYRVSVEGGCAPPDDPPVDRQDTRFVDQFTLTDAWPELVEHGVPVSAAERDGALLLHQHWAGDNGAAGTGEEWSRDEWDVSVSLWHRPLSGA